MLFKYIRNICFISTAAIFFSCSSESSRNALSFKNDFESVKGWSDTSRLTMNAAHSGMYSSKTDPQDQYSYTFRLKMKDISSKPLKTLHFSAWCYAESLPATGNIVVSIKNDGPNDLFYNATSLENQIIEEKKWTEVTGNLMIDASGINSLNNELRFYLINNSQTPIYLDDCTLDFSN
jgi:hypothetical protein